MKFRSISQLFFLLMLFCIHSSLTAQSGKIRGKISDASTGDPLPGSNLIFKELSIGGAADFNGEYMIFAVPAGRHILSVSYLGYESKELDVIITENRTFELNIKLEPLVLEGEEVLVTAQASAQQQAINQQLTSKTIKNIVSKKQIQELPEANAAEAVGRLPGVSLVRSGGEGNKLVIRGMAPKYSQIQIDGVTMAATGDQDRSVDLSMISPYMLEGIELTKSVMANQEATATGGIVNFRIRKAPDEMTLNAVAQGGYNGLRDTYNDYKLSVGGSNRFFSRSLGLYAQFDYEKANRGSQQLGGVSFSQENLEAPVRTNSIQLMDIFRDVERIGGTAVMDFSSPQFEIKLSNFFSRINREETRYTNSYAFSQNGFSLSYDDTPERSLTVLTNSLNIDYKWKDFEFNSVLSHSYSNNVLPARITSTNRNSPTNPFSSNRTSNYNVNLDPETIPDSLAIPLSSIADFMHLGDTYHEESETNERDLSAELNLAYYLRIADQINIKLNLGGKYKYKTKSYDQMTLEMSGQAYRNLVMENFENELSNRTRTTWLEDDQKILLIDFLDSDYGSNNLFDGKYEFSQIFDKEMFRKIHDLGMETYDPSDRTRDYWTLVFQNFIETTYNDYEGDENYYALYIMPEINIAGNLSVVPGLRYESNRTEYTGYRGNRLGVLQNYLPTPVDTVTKVRNNEFFLPMIQIFYEPAAWLTLKAGYTHTLQRPDYNNIMPGWVITNQGQINNLSNFRLKPELSRNWDLQLSFHSDKIGLFSAGVFHKKITDMIFWTGTTVITDTAFFDLPTIMNRQRAAYATNNPNDAVNYGFEIEYQSNFWFLPGLLSGLVLNVNYTRNKSEAEYLRSVVRTEIDPVTYRATLYSEDTTYTSRMIGQPDHLLNLTIGYDIAGFSIRWAVRYTSGIFKSSNWYEELRGFSSDFIRYDLAIRQKLPVEGMEMFFNVNNLTNEIEKDIINHMSFSRYLEDYGRTANLGFRYQF